MTPRFSCGDPVRVRDLRHVGHMRTPGYVRGRVGRIARVVGPMLNPEQLAYGRSGTPGRMLYRVRFAQADVWPDYRGTAADTLDVEIFEHWLEAAGTPRTGKAQP